MKRRKFMTLSLMGALAFFLPFTRKQTIIRNGWILRQEDV